MKQINVRFSREEFATLRRHAQQFERKLGPTIRYLVLEKLREENFLPEKPVEELHEVEA